VYRELFFRAYVVGRIGHTLRKEDGEIPKVALLWIPQEIGREENLRIAGEDRSSKKWVEAGIN